MTLDAHASSCQASGFERSKAGVRVVDDAVSGAGWVLVDLARHPRSAPVTGNDPRVTATPRRRPRRIPDADIVQIMPQVALPPAPGAAALADPVPVPSATATRADAAVWAAETRRKLAEHRRLQGAVDASRQTPRSRRGRGALLATLAVGAGLAGIWAGGFWPGAGEWRTGWRIETLIGNVIRTN